MFVKVTDGLVDQYPYTVGDLRRDNPNTSFPRNVPEARMAQFGVYSVSHQAAPSYNPLTHRLQSSLQPVLVNGAWVITKTIVELTDAQIASNTVSQAANIRRQRDTLLEDTDWMALSDVTMSAEMAAYRQSLRDITNHANFPYLSEADWPVKP
jgi:hypothetical protein